ncbi:hypothetical protein [Aliivibrio fischeri]|uniref:hypothetical protein n=1 Tax=Aliivibrio fischeri TaxID=668 RepID=UPI00166DCEC4|nr:hypothetical protein [Aliivibrio fischeri]USR96687.1 hypothetical protein AVFI_06435 [Aliivibrio fischeri ATCC 7744 = JCM 18803 = DSM 507]GGK29422.1 hypothetical protein GCM10007987_11620 [Aliivibrio fischeri]
MTNILKLNYKKAEYRDDYSDSSGEFWQCEAQESLINKLEITLREAKEYKKIGRKIIKKHGYLIMQFLFLVREVQGKLYF